MIFLVSTLNVAETGGGGGGVGGEEREFYKTDLYQCVRCLIRGLRHAD